MPRSLSLSPPRAFCFSSCIAERKLSHVTQTRPAKALSLGITMNCLSRDTAHLESPSPCRKLLKPDIPAATAAEPDYPRGSGHGRGDGEVKPRFPPAEPASHYLLLACYLTQKQKAPTTASLSAVWVLLYHSHFRLLIGILRPKHYFTHQLRYPVFSG